MKLRVLLFSFSNSTSCGSETSAENHKLESGEAYVVDFLPGMGHAFFAALDGDLIGLNSILLGHIDFDTILVLEPLDVLSLCANNGSVILPGNSKELDSLVRHFLDLGENPFLGLFGVPLATSDLDDALSRRCALLLPNRMLDHLRVFDVDFHIELVAVLLDTCTTRANNTSNEITGNGELKALLNGGLVPMAAVELKGGTYKTALNLVRLGFLDDFVDFFDSTRNVCGRATDSDCITRAKLDSQGLAFTDDPIATSQHSIIDPHRR